MSGNLGGVAELSAVLRAGADPAWVPGTCGTRYSRVVEEMVSAFIDEYYPTNEALAADDSLRSWVAALPRHCEDAWQSLRCSPAPFVTFSHYSLAALGLTLLQTDATDHDRLGKLYDKSDVIAVITTNIVYVTGMHNHLGNIADYIRSPLFVSPKVKALYEII